MPKPCTSFCNKSEKEISITSKESQDCQISRESETSLYKVENENISLRKAAKDMNISYSFLQRRASLSSGAVDIESKNGRKPVFTNAEEEKMAHYLSEMAARGMGLRTTEFLNFVGNIIIKEKRPNPFTDNTPGYKWYRGFMERNKHTVEKRTETPLESSRAKVTPYVIDEWFHKYRMFISDNELLDKPERIYNADETGFTMGSKSGKVIGPSKSVHAGPVPHVSGGKSKERVTVMYCANAAGTVIPPYFVFAKPKPVSYDHLAGTAKGSDAAYTDKGWMDVPTFKKFIGHLDKYGEKERPIVLLIDSVGSHVNIECFSEAKEHGIEIYRLVKNATHIMQPLDVGVYGPLKSAWYKHLRVHNGEHPDDPVSKKTFARHLHAAFMDFYKPLTVQHAFTSAGILFQRSCIERPQSLPSNCIHPMKPSRIPCLSFKPERPASAPNLEELLTSPSIHTLRTSSAAHTRPWRPFSVMPHTTQSEAHLPNLRLVNMLERTKSASVEIPISQPLKPSRIPWPIVKEERPASVPILDIVSTLNSTYTQRSSSAAHTRPWRPSSVLSQHVQPESHLPNPRLAKLLDSGWKSAPILPSYPVAGPECTAPVSPNKPKRPTTAILYTCKDTSSTISTNISNSRCSNQSYIRVDSPCRKPSCIPVPMCNTRSKEVRSEAHSASQPSSARRRISCQDEPTTLRTGDKPQIQRSRIPVAKFVSSLLGKVIFCKPKQVDSPPESARSTLKSERSRIPILRRESRNASVQESISDFDSSQPVPSVEAQEIDSELSTAQNVTSDNNMNQTIQIPVQKIESLETLAERVVIANNLMQNYEVSTPKNVKSLESLTENAENVIITDSLMQNYDVPTLRKAKSLDCQIENIIDDNYLELNNEVRRSFVSLAEKVVHENSLRQNTEVQSLASLTQKIERLKDIADELVVDNNLKQETETTVAQETENLQSTEEPHVVYQNVPSLKEMTQTVVENILRQNTEVTHQHNVESLKYIRQSVPEDNKLRQTLDILSIKNVPSLNTLTQSIPDDKKLRQTPDIPSIKNVTRLNTLTQSVPVDNKLKQTPDIPSIKNVPSLNTLTQSVPNDKKLSQITEVPNMKHAEILEFLTHTVVDDEMIRTDTENHIPHEPDALKSLAQRSLSAYCIRQNCDIQIPARPKSVGISKCHISRSPEPKRQISSASTGSSRPPTGMSGRSKMSSDDNGHTGQQSSNKIDDRSVRKSRSCSVNRPTLSRPPTRRAITSLDGIYINDDYDDDDDDDNDNDGDDDNDVDEEEEEEEDCYDDDTDNDNDENEPDDDAADSFRPEPETTDSEDDGIPADESCIRRVASLSKMSSTPTWTDFSFSSIEAPSHESSLIFPSGARSRPPTEASTTSYKSNTTDNSSAKEKSRPPTAAFTTPYKSNTPDNSSAHERSRPPTAASTTSYKSNTTDNSNAQERSRPPTAASTKSYKSNNPENSSVQESSRPPTAASTAPYKSNTTDSSSAQERSRPPTAASAMSSKINTQDNKSAQERSRPPTAASATSSKINTQDNISAQERSRPPTAASTMPAMFYASHSSSSEESSDEMVYRITPTPDELCVNKVASLSEMSSTPTWTEFSFSSIEPPSHESSFVFPSPERSRPPTGDSRESSEENIDIMEKDACEKDDPKKDLVDLDLYFKNYKEKTKFPSLAELAERAVKKNELLAMSFEVPKISMVRIGSPDRKAVSPVTDYTDEMAFFTNVSVTDENEPRLWSRALSLLKVCDSPDCDTPVSLSSSISESSRSTMSQHSDDINEGGASVEDCLITSPTIDRNAKVKEPFMVKDEMKSNTKVLQLVTALHENDNKDKKVAKMLHDLRHIQQLEKEINGKRLREMFEDARLVAEILNNQDKLANTIEKKKKLDETLLELYQEKLEFDTEFDTIEKYLHCDKLAKTYHVKRNFQECTIAYLEHQLCSKIEKRIMKYFGKIKEPKIKPRMTKNALRLQREKGLMVRRDRVNKIEEDLKYGKQKRTRGLFFKPPENKNYKPLPPGLEEKLKTLKKKKKCKNMSRSHPVPPRTTKLVHLRTNNKMDKATNRNQKMSTVSDGRKSRDKKTYSLMDKTKLNDKMAIPVENKMKMQPNANHKNNKKEKNGLEAPSKKSQSSHKAKETENGRIGKTENKINRINQNIHSRNATRVTDQSEVATSEIRQEAKQTENGHIGKTENKNNRTNQNIHSGNATHIADQSEVATSEMRQEPKQIENGHIDKTENKNNTVIQNIHSGNATRVADQSKAVTSEMRQEPKQIENGHIDKAENKNNRINQNIHSGNATHVADQSEVAALEMRQEPKQIENGHIDKAENKNNRVIQNIHSGNATRVADQSKAVTSEMRQEPKQIENGQTGKTENKNDRINQNIHSGNATRVADQSKAVTSEMRQEPKQIENGHIGKTDNKNNRINQNIHCGDATCVADQSEVATSEMRQEPKQTENGHICKAENKNNRIIQNIHSRNATRVANQSKAATSEIRQEVKQTEHGRIGKAGNKNNRINQNIRSRNATRIADQSKAVTSEKRQEAKQTENGRIGKAVNKNKRIIQNVHGKNATRVANQSKVVMSEIRHEGAKKANSFPNKDIPRKPIQSRKAPSKFIEIKSASAGQLQKRENVQKRTYVKDKRPLKAFTGIKNIINVGLDTQEHVQVNTNGNDTAKINSSTLNRQKMEPRKLRQQEVPKEVEHRNHNTKLPRIVSQQEKQEMAQSLSELTMVGTKCK
ncbi:LOW QUALITY PROTEIN: uncharacterized protein LOC128559734 [Mercenaria mercenaria]|uniref:LOW QUALITY PROTEIN: uncharacterized protein LOC128559734 n=1 Tax=Mercenaria mercenaria TaxID=6596 RepID=UPI00234E8EE1|nr:LOW QUALITY PROTEIN: uncharacterized protein LOC128559734 [Mercenaria mercenaria]